MGQPRQRKKRYSADDDIDEEERRGAGYIDEPKRSSYLPDSVHGSQRHMSNLAKNALVLVLVRVWLSACIFDTNLQSRMARNTFAVTNGSNSIRSSGCDSCGIQVEAG